MFGPDVVPELGRDVRRSTEGSVAFLTGNRGSGKSTQVLRLRDNPAESGYAVTYVSLEEYLNLHRPVEVVEAFYAMVGSVSDALSDAELLPDRALGWNQLRDWFIRFTRRIEVTAEVSAHLGVDVPGIPQADARVKARLQKDESFVAEMNRLLSGRILRVVCPSRSGDRRDTRPAPGEVGTGGQGLARAGVGLRLLGSCAWNRFHKGAPGPTGSVRPAPSDTCS